MSTWLRRQSSESVNAFSRCLSRDTSDSRQAGRRQSTGQHDRRVVKTGQPLCCHWRLALLLLLFQTLRPRRWNLPTNVTYPSRNVSDTYLLTHDRLNPLTPSTIGNIRSNKNSREFPEILKIFHYFLDSDSSVLCKSSLFSTLIFSLQHWAMNTVDRCTIP